MSNTSAVKSQFPKPLADFIDTDRAGHKSFCYPAQAGALKAILGKAHRDLQAALKLKGTAQREAVNEIAKFVAAFHHEHELIDAQWDEELESRRKRREAVRKASTEAA